MPIEIKELQITATSNECENKTTNTSDSHDYDSNSQIIAECVEQVLRILEEKKER